MSIKYRSYGELIKQGNLVAFPTETVYGLGASAWNPAAISQLFKTKGRPADNPLIVHVSNVDMIHDFTDHIPARAKLLMQKFWPGPLTIILKKKKSVLDSVTAGLDTVAIRMPDHPTALKLIDYTGPLVAPSANKSGKPSPTRAEHVMRDYDGKIPVIDGGDCKIGIESTVINCLVSPAVILRPGFVSASEIEQKCGFLPIVNTKHDSYLSAPASPGMKYSHYSPEAGVFWYESATNPIPDSYILNHSSSKIESTSSKTIYFNADYERFTRELYDWFRKTDIDGKKAIYIEPITANEIKESPILEAIKNRIDKAVAK